jgi:hypothetical protein
LGKFRGLFALGNTGGFDSLSRYPLGIRNPLRNRQPQLGYIGFQPPHAGGL